MAAASGPLFLASAGAAALQRRVADQCPEADRPSAEAPLGDPAAAGALARVGLPPPYQVVDIAVTAPFGVDSTPTPLTIYSRADVFDHVRVVRGGGTGLWVSDLEAG